jgi:hypothetical protein
MSKLEQIESAVASLAEKELKAFRRWFAEFDAARWERQIKRDSTDGKLGNIINKAKREHRKGKSTSL